MSHEVNTALEPTASAPSAQARVRFHASGSFAPWLSFGSLKRSKPSPAKPTKQPDILRRRAPVAPSYR